MALGHNAVSFPLSNHSFNLTSHPMTWQHCPLPFQSCDSNTSKQHKMSPPFRLASKSENPSFWWNSTLHFPPCCHTMSERLALMWLVAIQLYERNEQMLLYPPITIFHLALQSPLYSGTWSTFSLHFPFFSADCNGPYLFKDILRAA